MGTERVPVTVYFGLICCIFWVFYVNIYDGKGAHGGVVVKALRYKPQVAASIPDGVIGIFL
jgi:hypothetical protein